MPATWTTPRDWTAGELVTAAIGNSAWRDNLMYLKSAPVFDSNVTITGTLTQTGVATLTVAPVLSALTGVLKGNGASAVTASAQLAVADGGTGAATLTGILKGNGTSAITASAQLAVADGGTGSATLTSNRVLVGNGTSAVAVVAAGTSGQALISQGASAPIWSSVGGAVVSALTDGATPALDASLGSIFTLAAAGNRTIAVPSNATNGQKIVIRHLASGGARTLALNTGAGGFRFGTDITALTATSSGKTDYIGCIYSSIDSFWDVLAVSKGF